MQILFTLFNLKNIRQVWIFQYIQYTRVCWKFIGLAETVWFSCEAEYLADQPLTGPSNPFYETSTVLLKRIFGSKYLASKNIWPTNHFDTAAVQPLQWSTVPFSSQAGTDFGTSLILKKLHWLLFGRFSSVLLLCLYFLFFIMYFVSVFSLLCLCSVL